jgi:carbonic anhydrase
MSDDSSPELDKLIAGYRRFRDHGWTPRLERWQQLSEGQEPRVMIIACSDSRVDPAQIFDTDPGEMFVVRNVAAMVPPFETSGHHGVSAALEFAVQVLKVKEVVVMGHGMCGGCKAALTQELRGTEPGEGGFIADWIALLDEAREPVAEAHGTTGRTAERDGAGRRQGQPQESAHLPVHPAQGGQGRTHLRGAFFAISDGVLHLLDEASGDFHPVG